MRVRPLGLTVSRAPAYPPHAVAEHTIALMLSLDRKIHRAYARVRDGNFALDGLRGFDVYEDNEHLFFQDLSSHVIQDDVFARRLTFPNVVVTAHQAFFTREALRAISETTFQRSSRAVAAHTSSIDRVRPPHPLSSHTAP